VGPVREQILQRWQDFPVAQIPRPIVFLDSPVHLGDHGFIDSDAKTSWMAGAIEATVSLPDGLLNLITEGRPRKPAPCTLTITSIRPHEETFRCDRGPRRLPAYQLTVSGLQQPCTVIDPTIEFWWPRSADDRGHRHAHKASIEKDDRTLTFPAFGGVLTVFHRAEFAEYPTCVVGHAVTSEREAPPGTFIAGAGVRAMVTGHLDAPLDGRVLLHESGEPVAVLPVEVDTS
jgi:hypothetical protein